MLKLKLAMSDILVQDHLLFPQILWERPQNIYKRACGKILILAGSKNMSGAALLTAEAAFRSGAGLVILGYPENLKEVYQKMLPEAMSLILPETPSGSLSLKAFDAILQAIEDIDLVVLGPGLTRNRETQQLIEKLVVELNKPLVIDADGLNAIADSSQEVKDIFLKRQKETIITPHFGEMSRLTKIPVKEIEENKLRIAREYSQAWKIILVLKGFETVISQGKGRVVINKSGGPGLATAGTGDVLAGVIATFGAQNLKKLFEATATAVYIHGLAGDLAQKKLGTRSVIASDVIKNLSKAILKIEKETHLDN